MTDVFKAITQALDNFKTGKPPVLRLLAPMMSLRSYILLFALLILSACAPRHPLGISDEQWNLLSTEQRLQAHEKQASLDYAESQRRADEARAREAEVRAREAEAARQQAELDARRRTANYGERLQCVLGNAQARLGGKWRTIEPVALDLVQGMNTPFLLAEPAKHTIRRQSKAYARFDGQTIYLCKGDANTRNNMESCVRILGTHADYRRGINKQIESKNFLRGHLRCELVQPRSGAGLKHWR